MAGRPLKADSAEVRSSLSKPVGDKKYKPLKYFKEQDLELYYLEKQLKPGVEQEIKEGFFEIRKKFGLE